MFLYIRANLLSHLWAVVTRRSRVANRHFARSAGVRRSARSTFPWIRGGFFLAALVGFQADDWQNLPSFHSAAAKGKRQSELEQRPKAKRQKEVNIICRVLFSTGLEKDPVLFNQWSIISYEALLTWSLFVRNLNF